MGNSNSNTDREVHSKTGQPKEDRKISNKQPNPTSRRTRRTTKIKTQSLQKEGNNQDQAELNDIETKRTIQRTNKSRRQFFEKIDKIDKGLTRLIREGETETERQRDREREREREYSNKQK